MISPLEVDSLPLHKQEYILIEFCCSPTSNIGATAPPGTTVIRCTGKADDNVLEEHIIQKLLDIVRASREANIPVVLWGAIPCTGGSQWQSVNKAKHGVTEKLKNHWALFRRL